ncbi:hypothetical protein [Streptosporangium sp. NPDC000396]|uniref:hypothetical protein n=1 Tax=Streptosporangium sp. NPDC000396 TaxID=3366185 RepID=UPI0036C86F22
MAVGKFDQPYEVYDAEEHESGDLATRVKIKEEPQVGLSHALGDAVHSMRGADREHLAAREDPEQEKAR